MESSWLRWWTDRVPLAEQATFPRVLLALLLGSIIGAERQWHQRAAGMRTNTFVCLGAAAFVDLGITVGGPNSTNVIAYVVSGVGFLGAGAIMKDGGSIRGLNTAATLWCSAAVGACAGAGEMLDAVYVTMLLVAVNLALRPVSRYIDRHSLSQKIESLDAPAMYQLSAACPASREAEVRGLILRAVAERPLLLRELRSEDIGETDDVFLRAEVEATSRENQLWSSWQPSSVIATRSQRSNGRNVLRTPNDGPDVSIDSVEEHEVYSAIGEEGFEKLIAAFYRQVPNDPVLGPMYPAQDFAGAEKRLRDFLIFRFGGPQRYIEERGHPRLRMRHAPFPVDQEARRHWLRMMAAALSEAEIPAEAKQLLWAYFESTAAAMLNRG